MAKETADEGTHQDHHGRLHPGHAGAEEARKARRQEKDARLNNRFSALLWLGQGRAPEEVAALLGVCPRTVRNWLQLYQRGGLEALCTLEYKGDPG